MESGGREMGESPEMLSKGPLGRAAACGAGRCGTPDSKVSVLLEILPVYELQLRCVNKGWK